MKYWMALLKRSPGKVWKIMADKDMRLYEKECIRQGYQYIAGVDEAGRGPLAGPLVVAGVILPNDFNDDRIDDSKKLTEKKRELLYDVIIENALAYYIVIYDEKKVDELNVYQGSKLGMQECIDKMAIHPDITLTDAMPLDEKYTHIKIIKGDAKSITIAAASILAKVTRDRIMIEYDKIYPEYGFKQNKGYPTKAHLEALEKYGATKIHRQSFGPVKNLKTKQLSFDF